MWKWNLLLVFFVPKSASSQMIKRCSFIFYLGSWQIMDRLPWLWIVDWIVYRCSMISRKWILMHLMIPPSPWWFDDFPTMRLTFFEKSVSRTVDELSSKFCTDIHGLQKINPNYCPTDIVFLRPIYTYKHNLHKHKALTGMLIKIYTEWNILQLEN